MVVSASLIFSGFTMVMPFLPLFIQTLGVDDPGEVAIWAGTVLGISPLCAAIFGPLWGRIADRYGLRIMALRIPLALSLIWLLTGFAQTVHQLFLLRALLGIFGGFNSFSIALITQLSPQDRVGKAIGTLQAVQILSAAVGPFLGGLLAGWVGIRNTFFATSVMCLLSLVLFSIYYRDRPAPQPRTPKADAGTSSSIATVLRLPKFAAYAAMLFAVTVIDRSFTPVIPLLTSAQTAGATEAARWAGLIISLAAFGESFSAWYSGRQILRASPTRFLVWRLLFGIVTSLALIFANSVLQLLTLRLLLALLAGGVLTVTYTLASRVIPASTRASAFGILSSFSLLGGAIGPFAAGWLASARIQWVFAADAMAYGLITLLVIRNDVGMEWGPGPTENYKEVVSPPEEL
ncbi:MAG: MFS transporter [Acidobacteriota bacterium]